jgi:hypothetical protein
MLVFSDVVDESSDGMETLLDRRRRLGDGYLSFGFLFAHAAYYLFCE